MTALDIVPTVVDLPGDGWITIGDNFAGAATGASASDLLDCVGPDFPEGEVVDTAASAHYIRLPRALVHGLGVSFTGSDAALTAEAILVRPEFAECLGRSVAADLDAQPIDAELLAIDVTATPAGHQVRFTGGDEHGVRPVHLDIIVVRIGAVVGLLWFGDTPEPFEPEERDHVVGRVVSRATRD